MILLTPLAAPRLRAAEVPPLNVSPSNEQLSGKFEWADLFTDDPGSEAQFYTALFGWKAATSTRNQRDFVLLSNDIGPVAGIIQRSAKKGSAPARWIGFSAVSSLSDALASVKQSGGTVLAKPLSVPQRGEQAIVADREGAVFGLIHSSSGDTPDYRPANGELAWAELFSKDPKSSSEFYRRVFSYQVSMDPSYPDQEHLFLSTGEIARAGVAPSPPWREGKSDWLLFVCVSHVADTAAKASSLGATILVPPHPSKHGGNVAVLADPAGGVIGLLEIETATELKETP